jgi:ribosomal subunit interface protein
VDITVSSRDAEITAALRTACEEKIGRLARFDDDLDRAEVHFFENTARKTADREVCEVTLVGRRNHLRAKVAAPDRFIAVDRVVNKLEHQLAKVKTRRDRRSQPRRGNSVHSRGSQNGLDTGTGGDRSGDRADDDGPGEVRMSERGAW